MASPYGKDIFEDGDITTMLTPATLSDWIFWERSTNDLILEYYQNFKSAFKLKLDFNDASSVQLFCPNGSGEFKENSIQMFNANATYTDGKRIISINQVALEIGGTYLK